MVSEYDPGKDYLRSLDYDGGLSYILSHVMGVNGLATLVINGAGPDVGKTTLSSDIVSRLARSGRPGLVYEDIMGLKSKFNTAKLLYPGNKGLQLVTACVPIKIIEQNSEFPGDFGNKMRESVRNGFIGDISAVLGNGVSPADMLFINLQSPMHTFPSEHFPADILITNQHARRKDY